MSSDSHGLRLTPDGSRCWQVNRASDDALVIDASSMDQGPAPRAPLPDGRVLVTAVRPPHST